MWLSRRSRLLGQWGVTLMAALWLIIVSCSARNVTPANEAPPEVIHVVAVRDLQVVEGNSRNYIDDHTPRDFKLAHTLTKDGNKFHLKLDWTYSGPTPKVWYITCEWEQIAPKDSPRRFLRGADCGKRVKSPPFESDLEPGTQYFYRIYVEAFENEMRRLGGGIASYRPSISI